MKKWKQLFNVEAVLSDQTRDRWAPFNTNLANDGMKCNFDIYRDKSV